MKSTLPTGNEPPERFKATPNREPAQTMLYSGASSQKYFRLFSASLHSCISSKMITSYSQIRQVHLIFHVHHSFFLQKHQHIDRHVNDLAFNLRVAIAQHQSLRDIILLGIQYIGQGVVTFIVLARLHLYRQHVTLVLTTKSSSPNRLLL